jgi:hypothetical protein
LEETELASSEEQPDPEDNKTVVKPKKSKSQTKAVLLSALFPGAGQYYLGERDRGSFFMGVEVLTWIGFAAFQHTATWKKRSYINYAELHAGIDTDGKDDEFYKNLAFYDSREQYNESGRIIDPGGPYYENDPSTYWYWDSQANREIYRGLRNDSKSDYRKATFMIGVAIFNRVIAGIDTFRIARRLKGRSGSLGSVDDNKIDVDIDANPFGSNPHVEITLSKKF